ncbi:MAG: exodeoxyribonuclease V subunit alpha [Actinomycetota bacterium]|nr:exodeoxyribonuclease V subunit alpha [Actinomycetota bacterium]
MALGAVGLLRAFNHVGALAGSDVHVALRLGRLGGEADERVLLAAAFAVRALRLGHVCTDVATIGHTITVDADVAVDLRALPWPEGGQWVDALSSSPLVAMGLDDPDERPLRLVGTRLYLDRYWREERQVASALRARAAAVAPDVDLAVLAGGLSRLFDGPEPDRQRLAAASAVLRRFAVVAGGPGTGKTTTVARILALVHDQARAAGTPPPLVALAAPTGKAAARLEEAVHQEAARLDVSPEVRKCLLAVSASTLHRLLGRRPGNRARFRHHRGNRLPHEVVVVDETSMVSLSLMASLVEAVRPRARLVLVGDPEQLASVEAGAVLGDIVGPAAGQLLMSPSARADLAEVSGQEVPASDPPAGAHVADGIVVLRDVHRFGGAIAELAEAVQRGDGDAAIAVLADGHGDVTWLPDDVAGDEGGDGGGALHPIRRSAVAAGRAVTDAAHAGRGREALEALGGFRLLCAHRRGPYGVSHWTGRVERWIGAGLEDFAGGGGWYVGRPLLVTENDYGLRLYNGDTGVVMAGSDGEAVRAVFERRGELIELSPHRLGAVDTVYAMTVHKAQGSQFDEVAVLLPDPTSPILTRELLYTAVTRARRRLILAGTEETVRAALERPIARASGLREWLWEEGRR